jgi:hypothetical protein
MGLEPWGVDEAVDRERLPLKTAGRVPNPRLRRERFHHRAQRRRIRIHGSDCELSDRLAVPVEIPIGPIRQGLALDRLHLRFYYLAIGG